ncbi:MAG: xanthine dehydrogenase family protein subunit M [Deltaproteobacteria bacterium]|nr:MAG: xanthine dehydrogenase family protein subunit M [Deltaproteobacteria bacterium]
MKPAPFEYFAPLELQEALDLLERYGDEAKILAGGQSLMPLMNLRLARPGLIIDINRLSSLDTITATPEGGLTIGALTRQRALERSKIVQEQNPILAAAMPLIGHFQIRNRGTIGGSLVHADPAAELPAVSLLLGAEFLLRSKSAVRVVPAAEFFLSYLTTAIRPAELLTEIRLPKWPSGEAWAVQEIARRKGDFALIGVALRAELDGEETVQKAVIVMFGVDSKPLRMERAEAVLKGRRISEAFLRELSGVVAEELEPDSDIHASAAYRKEVGGVLVRRALESALAKVKETRT